MNARRLLLLLVLTAGLAAGAANSARAQTVPDVLRFSEHLPAAGARMIGLAGAGIGGYADAGMFFTNPAGLGYFQASQVTGALSILGAREAGAYYVPTPDAAAPFSLDESMTDYGGA